MLKCDQEINDKTILTNNILYFKVVVACQQQLYALANRMCKRTLAISASDVFKQNSLRLKVFLCATEWADKVSISSNGWPIL